jgi:hypothetical protein
VDFYSKLKERLESEHSWPGPYLFKFVVPETQRQVLLGLMPVGLVQERWSSNRRYVSVSVKTQLASADEVIAVYQRVTSVEGVLSL